MLLARRLIGARGLGGDPGDPGDPPPPTVDTLWKNLNLYHSEYISYNFFDPNDDGTNWWGGSNSLDNNYSTYDSAYMPDQQSGAVGVFRRNQRQNLVPVGAEILDWGFDVSSYSGRNYTLVFRVGSLENPTGTAIFTLAVNTTKRVAVQPGWVNFAAWKAAPGTGVTANITQEQYEAIKAELSGGVTIWNNPIGGWYSTSQFGVATPRAYEASFKVLYRL